MEYLIGFIFGAILPTFLLIRQGKQVNHLLNVILKREKVATLDKPFNGIQEKSLAQTDEKAYKDRHSMPTAIDVLLNQAEEEDTREYGKAV